MRLLTSGCLAWLVADGKQTADDWRFTKVYVRQNGAWRVVSFHASDSPPSQ